MTADLTPAEREAAQLEYIDGRYEIISHFPFVAPRPILLADHDDEAKRRCRFCARGKPEVRFRKKAHAVAHLLGNKSIISMNECDECNGHLGKYEDQLGKWTLFARALSHVPGKKNKLAKFKGGCGKLKIEHDAAGVTTLHLPSPRSPDALLAGGFPAELPIAEDTESQPYIPIEAAKALVKIACSVCPPSELGQCATAIDWLMGRRQIGLKPFPVWFAFTPGPISNEVSDVVLLRRKQDSPEPYLWCVVQCGNLRFQVFVPFCPADRALIRNDDTGCTFKASGVHCPSKFGPDWPFGPTRYGYMDWSGEEPVRSAQTAAICIQRVIAVHRPGQKLD